MGGSASLPASPVHHKTTATIKLLTGRSKLQSPLLGRRGRGGVKGGATASMIDSSDDEYVTSGGGCGGVGGGGMECEEGGMGRGGMITTSENYRDLETFQKAQLNKKVELRFICAAI
jgi:hypothetical protein